MIGSPQLEDEVNKIRQRRRDAAERKRKQSQAEAAKKASAVGLAGFASGGPDVSRSRRKMLSSQMSSFNVNPMGGSKSTTSASNFGNRFTFAQRQANKKQANKEKEMNDQQFDDLCKTVTRRVHMNQKKEREAYSKMFGKTLGSPSSSKDNT